MKKIQILGTGCPKCHALMANAEAAVKELGIDAVVEKVDKKSAKRLAEGLLRENLTLKGMMLVRDIIVWVAGHRKAIMLNAFGTEIYPVFVIIKKVALKD